MRVNCKIVDVIRNVELSLFCCLTHFTHLVVQDVIIGLLCVFTTFFVAVVL